MTELPGHGEVWPVSRLVQRLKLILVQELPPLWIEGEISNYSRSAAGHRYFSLKDEKNQLKAALFRGRSRTLKFEPADGLKVLAEIRLEDRNRNGKLRGVSELVAELNLRRDRGE